MPTVHLKKKQFPHYNGCGILAGLIIIFIICYLLPVLHNSEKYTAPRVYRLMESIFEFKIYPIEINPSYAHLREQGHVNSWLPH